MRAGEAQPDSIGIKNEDAAIIERDFSGLPAGFVAVVGILPVEAWLIVIGGDPLFDGLPGWLDGLESVDVEGRIGRWGDVDEALPHPEESKEKLNFLRLNESLDSLHGSFAAGALKGIGSPGGEDEVAPERLHRLGAGGWRRDEEGLGCGRWRFLLGVRFFVFRWCEVL